MKRVIIIRDIRKWVVRRWTILHWLLLYCSRRRSVRWISCRLSVLSHLDGSSVVEFVGDRIDDAVLLFLERVAGFIVLIIPSRIFVVHSWDSLVLRPAYYLILHILLSENSDKLFFFTRLGVYLLILAWIVLSAPFFRGDLRMIGPTSLFLELFHLLFQLIAQYIKNRL